MLSKERSHAARIALRTTMVLLVAVCVGCDHATKWMAQTRLRDHGPVSLVPGILDLTYTENHDVAFDVLSRLSLQVSPLVLVASAFAIAALLTGAWVRRRGGSWTEHGAFALLLSGALGNGLDRLARGHVIDFIHLRFWPVFNVADVAVVAGALLLLGRARHRVAGAPVPTLSAPSPKPKDRQG